MGIKCLALRWRSKTTVLLTRILAYIASFISSDSMLLKGGNWEKNSFSLLNNPNQTMTLVPLRVLLDCFWKRFCQKAKNIDSEWFYVACRVLVCVDQLLEVLECEIRAHLFCIDLLISVAYPAEDEARQEISNILNFHCFRRSRL